MLTRSLTIVLSLGLAGPLAAKTYKIDPVHSGVSFSVAHLMVSKVSGRFERFEGAIDYEKNKPKIWAAQVKIETASINTNNEKRDGHLKSPDFLEAEKYPDIIFKSSKIEKAKGSKAKLHGDLTLHGVTKSVVLDVEIGGTIEDAEGNEHFGATAKTKVNRKDFGIVWQKMLKPGELMVGEEVEITLEIEAVAEKG